MVSDGRVAWQEGLFLRPQHFQHQDRHIDGLIHASTMHLRPYPWGVSELEIDRTVFAQGRFGLRRAVGVMADGAPFAFPGGGPVPESIEIPRETQNEIIYLALALRAEGPQFSRAGQTRYVIGDREVIDTYAADPRAEDIEVAHVNLRLAITDDQKSGRTLIGVAKVKEVLNGAVILDDDYIPPCLEIRATRLSGYVGDLVRRARGQIEVLVKEAVTKAHAGRDAIVSFLMLQALNRWTAVLEHQANVPGIHPERLYETLSAMLGDLVTVSPQRATAPLDPYDHKKLQEIFEPLYQKLQALISEMVNPTATPLGLTMIEPGKYGARITNHESIRNDAYYLAVTARIPEEEIVRRVPGALKIASSSQINHIVRNNLGGIAFNRVSTPPPQINALGGWVYFEINRSSPDWVELASANGVGVHVAGLWDDLKLELWAVKRDAK